MFICYLEIVSVKKNVQIKRQQERTFHSWPHICWRHLDSVWTAFLNLNEAEKRDKKAEKKPRYKNI